MQISFLNNNRGLVKDHQKTTFGESLDEVYPELKKHTQDELLPDTFKTKAKAKAHQLAQIPGYVSRGLQGDPDADFHEFLKITKIPFFIGGPMLAVMYLMGKNRHVSTEAKTAAKAMSKRVALGVGMYYVGVTLAKAVVDIPLKKFRGMDMNRKYKHMVDLSPTNPDYKKGEENKKVEYHNWLESRDFPYLGLAYNYNKAGDGEHVNSEFDKMAQKFGIDPSKKLNDSDSLVEDKIKQTIAMANAWKYMLSAPFVATGLAISAQPSFKHFGAGLTKIGSILLDRGNRNKIRDISHKIGSSIFAPFGHAVKELWGSKGTGTTSSRVFGRAAILTSLILPIVANAMILSKTSLKSHNFVENKTTPQEGGVK